VLLHAFGYTMNPINLIVAYGVTNVIASIPIMPGGLGVVETALPLQLAAFGAPAAAAGFAVLAWRLVQFWMPIPLGGLSYASLKLGPLGRRRRLAAVRDLAREAGENARVRVWDQETGEYRMVRAEAAGALLAAAEAEDEPIVPPAGLAAIDEPLPDHPVVDDLDDDEDDPQVAAGPI
jgi:hypothetical protein